MIQLIRDRLALLCCLLGAACAARQEPIQVPRRVGDRLEHGPFVPPFAYEAYLRGELALSRGQLDEAIAQFELATAAPTEDAYLLSRLALAHARAGHSRRASHTLKEAERVDPCSEAVWLTRAELARDAHDFERAARAYREAMRCAPASPRGPLGLIAVHAARGAHHEALGLQLQLAEITGPGRATLSLLHALEAARPADITHALSAWLAAGTAARAAIAGAVDQALERSETSLAVRLAEHYPGELPPPLAARLALATLDRAKLSSLLSRHDGEALGGHAFSARLALAAQLFERAALEATLALARDPADAEARAARAEAEAWQGQLQEAAADLRQVPLTRKRVAGAANALSVAGQPALGAELRVLSAGGRDR